MSNLSAAEIAYRIARSPDVGLLLSEEDLLELRAAQAAHPITSPEDVPAEIEVMLKDALFGSSLDMASYYVASDDDGNPTGAGPWPATVYGFADVWWFSSPEKDDAFFGSRYEAIGHLESELHECIFQTEDYPIQPWQNP